MWNWQQPDWPNFSYDVKACRTLEDKFLLQSGQSLGGFKYINEQDENTLKIELITDEAVYTSAIEGEYLSRDSIMSSLCKNFDLALASDHSKVQPAEKGIAAMMTDLYKTYSIPLTNRKLHLWHKLLMSGRTVLKNIGDYRDSEEPMRIVSGKMADLTIYFEAPPSNVVKKQMAYFIKWFNGSHNLPCLVRASIAHLYFVCIHPYEDGNGRIARALAEITIGQKLGFPSLLALSYTINADRNAYYKALQENNQGLDITAWICYFSNLLLLAQTNTQKKIEFVIFKDKLLKALVGKINHRQEKCLLRMFKEGTDGFKGGLSADNYMKITKASSTTASRDLRDLVEKGALLQTGSLRYTRYYLNTEASGILF